MPPVIRPLTLSALVVLVVLTALVRQPATNDGAAPVNPDEVYDPSLAGEPLPEGWRELVPRDVIRPVYTPRLVPAARAGWPDDAPVIGVAAGDEAHAYPLTELNRREIVNDVVGGVPLLVSW